MTVLNDHGLATACGLDGTRLYPQPRLSLNQISIVNRLDPLHLHDALAAFGSRREEEIHCHGGDQIFVSQRCSKTSWLWLNSVQIVALGCPVALDGHPTPDLQVRIDKAIQMAILFPTAHIIATGGAVHSQYSEASCICDALTSAGIDHGRILCDYSARDTHENAGNALDYVLNWPTTGNATNSKKLVVVVTESYHMPRAIRWFHAVLDQAHRTEDVLLLPARAENSCQPIPLPLLPTPKRSQVLRKLECRAALERCLLEKCIIVRAQKPVNNGDEGPLQVSTSSKRKLLLGGCCSSKKSRVAARPIPIILVTA